MFPFLSLWVLFILPGLGLMTLLPNPFIATLYMTGIGVIRYFSQYQAVSGQVSIDFVIRLITSCFVGLIILFVVAYFVKKTTSLIKDLEHLSLTDNLTAVYNRRYFELYADNYLVDSSLSNKPLCLLVFDIDHFKAINDTFGHNAGDLILQKLTQAVQMTIRKTDMFIRMGGEEFALLMPNTTLKDGIKLAEKIRIKIAHSTFHYKDRLIPVTISTGVTQFTDESLDELMYKADIALYEAKKSGRNRVSTFQYNPHDF